MTTDTRVAAAPSLGIDSSAVLSGFAPGRPNEPHRAQSAGLARSSGVARLRRVGAARPAEPVSTEVLGHDHFVAQLQREKRRADRSETALSLVIYRLAKTGDTRNTELLREVLIQNKRETDILGQLAYDRLAVICTDTGDEGVKQFTSKIDACSGDLPYSVECATYPDQLFEGLSASPAAVHGPSPLLLGRQRAARSDVYFLKRPMDVAGALLALLLLSPLMLLTALLVKLSSPGPVIFRQSRLGRGGAPFAFYKFRSMVVNGDDRIHREFVAKLIKGEHAEIEQEAGGPSLYKIKADPRVTWIGRIIRKTSIDELPQLFNVLKGDMSLVGPRPPLPYEAENYQSWHLRRVLDIKPGITGLWQVEGRSKVSFDEMVRMDLRYVRGCSLWLDLSLLVRTVRVVLKCEGAT
jgi:lipopolysaccharide/colanic/teichoic acid biosynthesis glycosyltransferase